LIRGFVVELAVYAALVVAYFLLVLRLLGEPLNRLFHSSLPIYALAALGLIVVQAVALESLTSFLLRRLGLDH